MMDDGAREQPIPTEGVQGVVQVTWGSAPQLTDADAARVSPGASGEPDAAAGHGRCTSFPAIVRMGIC